MNWYYAIEGRAHGPVDEQRLAELAAEEAVTNETLLWSPGMEDWEPVWKAKPDVVGRLSKTVLAQKARGSTDRIPLLELEKTQAADKADAERAQGGLLGRLFGRGKRK